MKYLLIALCFIASMAQAEYLDLTKGKVLQVGECEVAERVYPCVAVEYKGNMYLVLIDRKGVAYQILIGNEGNAEITYARDMI